MAKKVKQKPTHPIIALASKYFVLIIVVLSFALVGTWLLIYSQAGSTPYFSKTVSQDHAAKINNERSSRGIAKLKHVECLNNLAEKWSQKMAVYNKLYHNPSLRNSITGWCGPSKITYYGENVGVTYPGVALFPAFMASAGHRANILDRDYNSMGIGTYVDSRGKIWVTHVFAKCVTVCSPNSALAGTVNYSTRNAY
jgi:uncharacterized protein YkwD